MTPLTTFLLQALIIVSAPYALSLIFKPGGVIPPVVVQVLSGIALGPSVLGQVAPASYAALFRPDSLEPLSHVASLGLVLFGFTTGMHLQWASLRERTGALTAIWIAGLIAPAVLGALAGLWLIRCCNPAAPLGVAHWQFAAGIAICCTVTALPVLAAILREMGLHNHRVGQMALAIAAGTDCALWLALSALLALGGTTGRMRPLSLFTPGFLLLYWILQLTLMKRLLKYCTGANAQSGERLTLVLACSFALGGALLAESGGVHYLLGSFIAGAAVPANLRNGLLNRIEPLTLAFMMPFFFMMTGLKTLIDVGSPVFMSAFAAVTVAALVGKVGGVALAARIGHERWSVAIALGALVQTKGLMEVVVATVFLEAGIFGREVFSAVVAMAVFCTCLSAPVVRIALRRQPVIVPEHAEVRIAASAEVREY